jgi:hypothetical protein
LETKEAIDHTFLSDDKRLKKLLENYKKPYFVDPTIVQYDHGIRQNLIDDVEYYYPGKGKFKLQFLYK